MIFCSVVMHKYYLRPFLIEIRKCNGEQYPPATLHSLLCGLNLHHMKSINGKSNSSNYSNVINHGTMPGDSISSSFGANLI